ncbi:MAG: hypothetical protein IJW53_04390 [Clostridia bacterium]|nr:hypothetical protein [Clostridia bacterium]
MEIYRVCLFGHRDFNGHKILDIKLFELLKRIICEKDFVEIYIGRNGEFDIYAASVIKRVQKALPSSNNEIICVLPYQVKDIEYYERYYDSVIIPEYIQSTHPKRVIIKRNEWMIDACELVICYVERENGGAYRAMKYAQKSNKEIINLADE